MTLNPAEALTARIARHSFFALWSYSHPRGKNGKELCDVLVVCDPDVIILSVKEVAPRRSGDRQVDWERWHRRAIDESVKQIYGAERWLRTATHVTQSSGTQGIALPGLTRRRTLRIAIAFAGHADGPIEMRDFGKGFVHVLTEDSLDVLLGELDTIEDLSQYLLAKEKLLEAGTKVIIQGTEQDLLARYLANGRAFPSSYDLIVIQPGMWRRFTSRSEYQAKKDRDRESRLWDRLVDRLSEDVLEGRMEFGPNLNANELAIRAMARESRFSRRFLGRALREFYDLARQKKVASRIVESPSKILYVFLATPHGHPRDARTAELECRCFVARGLNPSLQTVIGIATEQHQSGKGSTLDIVRFHLPLWTEEHQVRMEQMQDELGYFRSPRLTRVSEDEYPHPAMSR